MKNGERYDEVMQIIKEIEEFFKSIEDDATFEVHEDKLVGTMVGLRITCVLVSMTAVEIKRFCELAQKTDGIEIDKKTDGKICISFTFYDAYTFAPPRTENKK